MYTFCVEYIQYITQYYGADWIGMFATFFSLYLLGEKKRVGFIFGCVAAIAWLVFSYFAGSIPGAIANGVFAVLNLRGYFRWGKDK